MSTASSTGSASGGRRRPERGTGVIGSVIGVLIFLVTLLFAVQVLVGLYATTVLTAAAYDAARAVSGADAARSAAARSDAERNARSQLGPFGDAVRFRWTPRPGDEVALTVWARRPTILPDALLGGMGLGEIERTVRVRSERVR